MQPTMTMTATATADGADAPADLNVIQEYLNLNEENREKVNRYVQTLLREQCTP